MLDEEIRDAGSEVDGGRGSHWSAVVVWSDRDVISFRQYGDAARAAIPQCAISGRTTSTSPSRKSAWNTPASLTPRPNPKGVTVSPETLRTASRLDTEHSSSNHSGWELSIAYATDAASPEVSDP